MKAETDLYWNRGYKYAANEDKLEKLLAKLDETGVEVYRIERKGENLAGDIFYFTLFSGEGTVKKTIMGLKDAKDFGSKF